MRLRKRSLHDQSLFFALTTKRSFSLPGRDNVLGVAIKCDIASSSPLLMDSEGGDNTSADPGRG